MAEADDIDVELYEKIEATFHEIILLVGEARDDERIPGCGPDRPDDVVAVLVSQRYKNQLDLPFYRIMEPLSDYVDLLEVPLIPFGPLEEDYSPLFREEAEALFDGLAEGGLAREELRIAERVLAEFDTLDQPMPHHPGVLRTEVALAWPGELDSGRWPAA